MPANFLPLTSVIPKMSISSNLQYLQAFPYSSYTYHVQSFDMPYQCILFFLVNPSLPVKRPFLNVRSQTWHALAVSWFYAKECHPSGVSGEIEFHVDSGNTPNII
eukprot:1150776-Pelagomonas_calceolata.AAC.11